MKPIYRPMAIKNTSGADSRPDLWAVIEEHGEQEFQILERLGTYAAAQALVDELNGEDEISI